MTKKDYELIAGRLKYEKPGDMEGQEALTNWRGVCRALATAFRLKNPKFDRDKFLQACGVKE